MTAPRTQQVLALLTDYALDPWGRIDGLTTHEFERAWQARHHTRAPVGALYDLTESGCVRPVTTRTCAVSQKTLRPWVPRRFAS